jgi:protein SCO1/2
MSLPKPFLYVLTSLLLASVSALADETTTPDPHSAHKDMMHSSKATVHKMAYSVPDVQLLDAAGQSVKLRDVLSSDEPLVVNFIFTTCTTICPVITSTTLQMQKQLGDDAVVPRFVTISIDPDYDTSEVLHRYAQHYGADWTFLTGESDSVLETLKAFDAYRGNKVNHFALTLMHASNDEQWTRVEGLVSARELADIWYEVSM